MADAAGLSSAEIADRLQGRLDGPGDVRVTGVGALHEASAGEVTFVHAAAFAERWGASSAAAVVVTEGVELPEDARPRIVVPDAEQAMVSLLEYFAPPRAVPGAGVHPAAWVHEGARLGAGVRVGAGATIEDGCVLGDGVIIHPGVHLYAHVEVGDGSELHSGVVIRERCRIGRGVILHGNVTIGADGFGYRPAPDGRGLVKVPQIGIVIIEDGVEIGANTCVDRAKTGATVIGAGTKIDDLVMVGHNCRIGRCCIIAGLVGLAGSVELGDGVVLAGGSGVRDHVKLGDGAKLGVRAIALEDMPAGAEWLGLPAGPAKETLRQWAAIRKLPRLIRRFRGGRMADPESGASGGAAAGLG